MIWCFIWMFFIFILNLMNKHTYSISYFNDSLSFISQIDYFNSAIISAYKYFGFVVELVISVYMQWPAPAIDIERLLKLIIFDVINLYLILPQNDNLSRRKTCQCDRWRRHLYFKYTLSFRMQQRVINLQGINGNKCNNGRQNTNKINNSHFLQLINSSIIILMIK